MKRRPILVLVAALLVIVDAVALAHFTPPSATDGKIAEGAGRLEFVIETGMEADEMIFGDPHPLPLFDRATGTFTFEGEPVADFAPFVRGLELGPHGSNPFILVALPPDATMRDYAAALVPLVDQGICRIGVYEPFPAEELRPDHLFRGYKPSWPGRDMTAAFRVQEIRPHAGVVRTCRDRFPPWNGYARIPTSTGDD